MLRIEKVDGPSLNRSLLPLPLKLKKHCRRVDKDNVRMRRKGVSKATDFISGMTFSCNVVISSAFIFIGADGVNSQALTYKKKL